MNTTAWPEGIKKTKQREAIWSVLTTKGIVTRTTLMGSDMAYYEITPHTHRHYAVCTKCGAMIPLHTCPVVKMPQELTDAGFTVTEHHLEIAGICRNCKDKNK